MTTGNRKTHITMRLIVTGTTAAWVGILACVFHTTGKGTFGGYLPNWIPTTTILLACGTMILTFLASLRILFDRRESCGWNDLFTFGYGFSIAGVLALLFCLSTG